MEVVKEYKDDAEKEQIISSLVAKGATLKEIQNHFDGDFLVFDIGVSVDELVDIMNDILTRVKRLEGGS